MTKKLFGLYAITNEKLMPEADFLAMAEAALISGAKILQYRDKSTNSEKRYSQATALKKLCAKHNACFIINDDIELLKQVDADGIHIGKNDSTLPEVRKQLGAQKIIGVSCYNQIELAQNAIQQGADYIAFGSFFGSSIKPNAPQANIDLITTIKKQSTIPICCIGGITLQNHLSLLGAGADMLAVISDLFSHPDPAIIVRQCAQYNDSFNNRL